MLSTLAKKTLVAFTGLALGGFLLVHVAGNLPLLSTDVDSELAFNSYAFWLSERFVIKIASYTTTAFFILHIALSLTLNGKARRTQTLAHTSRATASLSPWRSRAMVTSGIVLAVFLVIHLADFWYPFHFEANFPRDDQDHKQLYALVATALQVEWRVALYVLAMFALSLHLSHGIFSACRSLGLYSPRLSRWSRYVGFALALLVPGAFVAMVIRLYLTGLLS